MKKIIASLGFLLVMSAVGLAVPTWDITGTWTLDFDWNGGQYVHTMTVTSFNKWTGDFVGTGVYNSDPSYTWTVAGTVSASSINFQILYTGTNAGYTVDATGAINDLGAGMVGENWLSSAGQSGTWAGTGIAKQIPLRCVKIKEGLLKYSAGYYLAGQPLVLGYDAYGYNYQAHVFDGSYANAYLGGYGFPAYTGNDDTYFALPFFVNNPAKVIAVQNTWVWPYRADRVLMKWNDAWLSNMDCNADAKLDRPTDKTGGTYIGSGAWETNHQWGTYVDGLATYSWNYFVKIVAAPDDATLVGGVWTAADGTQIGTAIWGDFAITQEVYNDQGTGDHGLSTKFDHPGLGTW
jgi:hypothetical protein